MLKIDIIKFEAQDVITSSVANGNLTTINPANQCECITVAKGTCFAGDNHGHGIGRDQYGSIIYCMSSEHTCNRNH